MPEGLKTQLRAYRGGLEVGLLIILLAVLAWQSLALYGRLTASPARWAAAMAAGETAFDAENWPAARDAYGRALTEGYKFGPHDARLALALDAHALAMLHADIMDYEYGLDFRSMNLIESFRTIREEGLGSWKDYQRKRSAYRRSINELHRSTAICRAIYGTHHPRTADALIQEAVVMPDNIARPLAHEAMADWRATSDVPKGKEACFALLVAAERSASEPDTAFAMFLMAFAGAKRDYAPGDRWMIAYLGNPSISEIILDVNDKVAAERFLRKGLDWTTTYLPKTSYRTLEVQKNMSKFCEKNGRDAEARDFLVQRVTACTSTPKTAPHDVVNSLTDLADFDTRRGNTSLAADEKARAIALLTPPTSLATPPSK